MWAQNKICKVLNKERGNAEFPTNVSYNTFKSLLGVMYKLFKYMVLLKENFKVTL